MAGQNKIAVVTVHGTGDTAEGLEGPKWFQRGSKFSEKLRERLAAAGVEAEIVPLLWSGANSASEREKGAEKLARELKGCARRYEGVHIVGHSHGGNVANEAALHLRWGRKPQAKHAIASMVTVGTPFLNLRSSVLQRIAGVLFLVLTWGSLIAAPLIVIGMWFGSELRANLPLFLVTSALIVACTLFMFSISLRGARRIGRPRKRLEPRTPVLAIWHENDEAISFLRRVEELPVEAFPKGSMFRSSRAAAVSWGVLAVFLTGLAFPALYATGIADVFGIDDTPTAGRGGDMFASLMAGLVFAPLVFVAVYWSYRIVVGGGSEFAARAPLNGWVSGVLRGIAMGRDGDQVVGNVSTESHTHATQSLKLEGECAARMQSAAGAAADKLIEKYRWSLFTVGADTNAPLSNLATDAMTWDSLIHTTYFDQPEVAEFIAAHIVAAAKQ